jgi:hypothetical protein
MFGLVQVLDLFPLWAFLGLSVLLFAVAIEVGYRLGLWQSKHHTGEQPQSVGGMVASVLGLLALVLGFTFALAGNRFDSRRMAVLDEANAIGTTYLRVSVLPEPQRSTSRNLLRDYAKVRLRIVSEQKVEQGLIESEQIHEKLWQAATEAAAVDGRSTMVAIYMQSLNELIDMHAKRVLFGLRSRIPPVLWFTLFTLSVLSMALVGYQSGLSGATRSPVMLVLAVAFAMVILMIADLDRGQEGMLQVSQQAIRDVLASMERS